MRESPVICNAPDELHGGCLLALARRRRAAAEAGQSNRPRLRPGATRPAAQDRPTSSVIIAPFRAVLVSRWRGARSRRCCTASPRARASTRICCTSALSSRLAADFTDPAREHFDPARFAKQISSEWTTIGVVSGFLAGFSFTGVSCPDQLRRASDQIASLQLFAQPAQIFDYSFGVSSSVMLQIYNAFMIGSTIANLVSVRDLCCSVSALYCRLDFSLWISVPVLRRPSILRSI